ncbi:hypothetical protein [Streptomyces sp. NPDC050388]|uniref:hypothetical protein n=1 Tax=Streptomyces sp. NPDC050388 TaxID=3155781 RepID=UPI00342478CD
MRTGDREIFQEEIGKPYKLLRETLGCSSQVMVAEGACTAANASASSVSVTTSSPRT